MSSEEWPVRLTFEDMAALGAAVEALRELDLAAHADRLSRLIARAVRERREQRGWATES